VGSSRTVKWLAAVLFAAGLCAGGLAAVVGAGTGFGQGAAGGASEVRAPRLLRWGGDLYGVQSSREAPPDEHEASPDEAPPVATYVVRRGDTLCAIARRYVVNVRALARANGMNLTDILPVGRALAVPALEGDRYRVRRGDTLWAISRRSGTTVADLARRNGLDAAAILPVGKLLLLPGTGAPAAPAVAPEALAAARSARMTESMLWPVAGRVTSGFGPRWGRRHSGVDIAAPYGSTIHAAAAGKVTAASWMGGYGRTIMIRHDNGVVTLYGHASRLLVRAGQRVERGQAIGRVGSSGHSTGPHLHFEVIIAGRAKDPLPYLR